MVATCFATLNHSPLVGCDVDLLRQIDAIADCGFDGVELDIFSVRGHVERGGELETIAARIDRRGLRCFALAGLNVFDDEQRSQAESDELAAMCDAFAPDWLLVRFAGAYDTGVRFLERQLDRFDDTAIGFEPSPFTVLRTIGDARRAIDDVGTGAVIVDSWHFFATGADWAALAALPEHQLAYIQLDDGLEPSADLQHDTLHRRAVPGEGILDLARFATALRNRNFDGIVSTEVMSDEWRARTVEEFAAACRRSIDPLF